MYIKIKKIEDIVKRLKKLTISNEELYNLIDFENELKALNVDEIETDECVITPYYVDNGKRYELYAFELNIKEVERKDFNKYLLEFTGKEKIEDIPNEIVERQKKCYVEFLKEENYLKKQIIQDYITYIFSDLDVQKEIKQYFEKFQKEKLYFEIF